MNKLLEYNGYHAKVELDAEDGIFVGSVIGIEDSLNFHGKSVDELKAAFKICMDDYLEMCAHFHKDPNKEYKGSFNVRIPPELHKKLDISASNLGIPLNQLVSHALESFYSQAPVKEKIYVVTVPVKEQKWNGRSKSDIYQTQEPITNSFEVDNRQQVIGGVLQ